MSVQFNQIANVKQFFLAMIALAVTSAASFAQQSVIEQPQLERAVPQQQALIQPGIGAPAIQQNPFYFGMSVTVNRNAWGRTTLRIVSVTPGSPAHRAGLEFGDEIRTVNGRGFRFATDAFDAVRRMNQYVLNPAFGAGKPAPAVGVAAAYISFPNPSPLARMVVRNVRNGQNVVVNVRPLRVAGGSGAPAAAAMSAGG